MFSVEVKLEEKREGVFGARKNEEMVEARRWDLGIWDFWAWIGG